MNRESSHHASQFSCNDTTPTHGSFGHLNLNPLWKKKRQEVIARDGHKCVNCSRGEELEVHHRRYLYSIARRAYLKPWEYPNKSLVTLCRSCHQRGHQVYDVPVFLTE